MLKNPEKPGAPAIASVAMNIVQNVTGIFLRRPPILRMSCSPPMAWNHAARGKEEQSLEERMRHQVKNARR